MLIATASGDQALQVAARTASWTAFSSLASDTYTGRDVTPETARALGAVYACQRAIATGVGTMPLQTYRSMGGRQERAELGRLSAIIGDQPNADMSAELFWACMLTHMAGRGNAYAAKLRDSKNRIVELLPIHAHRVNPFRDATGKKWFRVSAAGNDDPLRDYYFDSSQIFHAPYLSFDTGLSGHSPVAVQRQRLGVGLAASEFQQRFFRQNGVPKAVIEFPTRMSPERVTEFRNVWAMQNEGAENQHRVAVLPDGAQLKPVGLGLEDAQFIEQMNYSDVEVARLYGLPAAALDFNTQYSLRYETTVQNDLNLVKHGLRVWAVMIEAALRTDPDLFGGSGYVAKFNFDALLRADIKTRSEVGRNWLKAGVKNPNELRELEDLPPREGGDEYVFGADLQSQKKADAETQVLLEQVDQTEADD